MSNAKLAMQVTSVVKNMETLAAYTVIHRMKTVSQQLQHTHVTVPVQLMNSATAQIQTTSVAVACVA